MTQTFGEAAAILWQNWQESTRIGELPTHCRPRDRAEGYAIQTELARLSGQSIAGWKIAATSVAGQKHIGVEGPLAGCLLSGRMLAPGSVVPLNGNAMRVAEAEFAFRMAKALPARPDPFSVEEVLDAVASLHPAIEIPDSRFIDFAHAGAPQLIADNACACWFVIGPEVEGNWRERDLVKHEVRAYCHKGLVAEGTGAKVMGDPRVALTWIANELRTFGSGLGAGDVVMTGTCVAPVPIASGDRIRMEFGEFGAVEVAFSA